MARSMTPRHPTCPPSTVDDVLDQRRFVAGEVDRAEMPTPSGVPLRPGACRG